MDVSPVVFNQQYYGAIESVYAEDQWTFSANANQQVRFNLIGSNNSGIKFRLQDPNGYVGFSSVSDSSSLITLPTSGNYILSASGGGVNVGNYSFRLESSVTLLTPEVAYAGTLPGSGTAQIFKVHLDDPKKLLVALDDVTNSDQNEVYVKFGRPNLRRLPVQIPQSGIRRSTSICSHRTCWRLVHPRLRRVGAGAGVNLLYSSPQKIWSLPTFCRISLLRIQM